MILIVVGFHEYGHFITARILGVKVITFSIGMGKKVFTKVSKKSGVEYALSILPIGGYVKMLDESDKELMKSKAWTEQELSQSFNRAPLWKRFLIVFNGPLFNFILAVFIFFIINLNGTMEVKPIIGSIKSNSWAEKSGLKANDQIISIESEETKTWYHFTISAIDSIGTESVNINLLRNNEKIQIKANVEGLSLERNERDILTKLGINPIHTDTNNIVGKIVKDSSAEKYSLEEDDIIMKINNDSIKRFSDIQRIVSISPSKKLEFTIIRDGEKIIKNIEIMEKLHNGKSIGILGIYPKPIDFKEDWIIRNNLSVLESLDKSVETSIYMIEVTANFVKKLFIGELSPTLISGPVTMANAAADSAEGGVMSFFVFCALISINLMIMNLLPIPGLDGGHLAFYIYAFIFREELSKKTQGIALKFGMLAVISLMLLAIFMDITDFFV
jgi:regulator of sigma E protease